MADKYTQSVTSGKTHFTQAPMAELEFSIMTDNPQCLTTFSAGDIVPIYCGEVLPHDTFNMSLDFVTRQATVAVPVMGQLVQDFYAFFVPNRIVNKSWKNVMGENTSGQWTAPQVSLAPLCSPNVGDRTVQIPVGSVADYYGFPTQAPLHKDILSQCHDLKFRGYLEIYNNYFRDQNYQPPIPYSKLNVFNGFFESDGDVFLMDGLPRPNAVQGNSDGSYASGSIVKELFGEGSNIGSNLFNVPKNKTGFSMLNRPLKANKLHDYFTSVLPSPQKGRQVAVPLVGELPINGSDNFKTISKTIKFRYPGNLPDGEMRGLGLRANGTNTLSLGASNTTDDLEYSPLTLQSSNIIADLTNSGVGISVSDLRLSSAIQRVYEILGNGGSRYTEFINSFFGIEVDNPFDDIPLFLGHFRRDLDLFQTAQTSASPSADSGAGTPQGNLTAFGYTNKDGSLFHRTFNEHGYIHVFTVVRHKNVYSSSLARDNFRLNMLDFYSYPLANISEQPVYTREINPFDPVNSHVFGYQEAWAEYRYEPDKVTGFMRPGINESLGMWTYADDFSSDLVIADGEWLKSNTEAVVTRSTAVQDRQYPQFKGQFMFHITKERPMPVYSVPGADIF